MKRIDAEVLSERDFDATVRRSSPKAISTHRAEVPLQEDRQREDKWRRNHPPKRRPSTQC